MLGLLISWERLGDVHLARGDLDGALEGYTASHAIRERLAATDPGNAGWQRDLMISHWKLAATQERLPGREAEVGAHWAAALAIARRLAAEGRLAPIDHYFVEELQRGLAATGTGSPAAVADPTAP